MFLNIIYTDGYTCLVMFARRNYVASPIEKVPLDLTDFNNDEIEQYFRPCTVDPNRKDVFASYHVNNDLRHLLTAEYYEMNGNINRHMLEVQRKKRKHMEEIETRIPSPKTSMVDTYLMYIIYMLENFQTLTNFCGFETARLRWSTYRGSQQVIEHAVGTLVNGSTKYFIICYS